MIDASEMDDKELLQRCSEYIKPLLDQGYDSVNKIGIFTCIMIKSGFGKI